MNDSPRSWPPHSFRFWRTYPPGPPLIEPRHPSRVTATCLIVGEVLLAAAVVILFVFVLDLRAARIHEAQQRQAAISATFCHVLDELPSDSPELQRIRIDLHCPQPGLSGDAP